MKTFLAVMLLLPALPSFGTELGQARELMQQNQPAKAGELVRQLMTEKPSDPWLAYDAGVAAYAAKDYQQADKIWQELAARELPPKLRDKVWTQVGNVSFRFGEQTETTAADLALPQYEQSREAYRVVLAARPKDKMAVYNLKVVELKLAKIHVQLAQRLLKEAQHKSLQETIDKLEAALDHQRTAQDLDPQNESYKQEVKKIEKQLAEKVVEKAAQEEKRADNAIEKARLSDWEAKNAEENLKIALADFQEAKALDPQNQPAQEGEKRVEDKLANLLAKEGRQFQKDAKDEEQYNREKAADNYEKALEKFEEALAQKPEHQDALAGEKEVKDALEKLLEKQGDQLAKEGRQEKPHRPDQAAEKMMNAMEDYQEAKVLNPDNQTVPPKIEALQKELPELLNALGKKEQQEAAKAEPKSVENAIAHLEKADTSYEMAQELDKDNQQAQQGQEQVQKDLARLREQVAQKAEAKNDQQQAKQQSQQQQQKQSQQNQQNFQAMLAQVKDPDKQKEYDESRRGQTKKYDQDKNRTFKNW